MNFSKYQNTLSYPEKPFKPSAQKVNTYDQAQEFDEAMKLYEAQMQTYYAKLREYRAEGNKLYFQFKADAIQEVGLAGHPKADKVFAKAWQDGHSNGYSEVFSVLEDLAELVL